MAQHQKEIISSARLLLDNQVDVSLSLAKHLLVNYGQNSNLVFSPISIQVVLSLLAAGSSGQTLDQLLTFLKAKTTDELNYLYSYLVDLVFVDGSITSGPCVSFANGVWLDKTLSLKPSFKQVLDTMYKAASHQVDFENKPEEARNLVNSWVEKKTNGLIKKIINSLSRSSRLVLANALYFKGEWDDVFDPDITNDYDFYLLSGKSIQVSFMRKPWERHYVSVFDGFKVMMLPYSQAIRSQNLCEGSSWNYKNRTWDKRRSFSMYIFLPDAKDGLSALVEKAGAESGFLKRHIPSKAVDVGEFRIPKFKFECKMEVVEALKTLGLVLPFDPNVGLSEMVDDLDPLFVSRIIHKSHIEINEEGTVAAAATTFEAEEGAGECSDEEVHAIDFVADHPFLFFIREDNSGMVLFIGQVLNPSTT